MTDLEGAARLCGFARCRQPVVPAAFVEASAFVAGEFREVRVEVCAHHFELCSGEHVEADA